MKKKQKLDEKIIFIFRGKAIFFFIILRNVLIVSITLEVFLTNILFYFRQRVDQKIIIGMLMSVLALKIHYFGTNFQILTIGRG